MKSDFEHRIRFWRQALLGSFFAVSFALPVLARAQDGEGDLSLSALAPILMSAEEALQDRRLDEARRLYEQAWERSGSSSAYAAIGLVRIDMMQERAEAAWQRAQGAIKLAKNEHEEAGVNLVAGAAGLQAYKRAALNGKATGEGESEREMLVRLGLSIFSLERGIELAEKQGIEAPSSRSAGLQSLATVNNARVLLAEAHLQSHFPEKARAVLDAYFDAGPDASTLEEAQNLRCLAGGPSADFEPPAPRDEISKPTRVSGASPGYTEEARKKGWQGRAVVQAVIDESGDVVCARAFEGAPYGLSENAVAAVRQWKYRPATHEGEPVKAMLYLAVNFKLRAGD